MDFLTNLDLVMLGSAALSIMLGLFVGMLFGALPGLGLIIGVTLLLPLSYAMSPVNSILMLLACYQGAEYGGSISAIVLGIPGTAMAAPIVLDGREMAKTESPGKALAYSLYGSTFGGIFGGLVLIFFAVPVARFALKLADPEFFLLGVVGLLAVATFGAKDFVKAMISVALGLLAGTVGLDLFTGSSRLTADFFELYEGLNLVAVAVGLFAFSEVFMMLSSRINKAYTFEAHHMKISLTFREMLGALKAMISGSAIGSFMGVLPGVGSTVSCWLAYSTAKATSSTPEKFGKGSGEGIAAPDAANNATVGGALLPFLALGIPGSASIAIIAGAFIIAGIQPGPQMMRNNPELIQTIFIGFMATTVGMFFMGKALTQVFVRALVTPNSFLVPAILISSLIGIYSSKGQFFDLWVALGLGIAAWIVRRLDYSVAAFVLAMVLTPIIEVSFRRALVLSQGDYSIFYTRIYSQVILVAIAVVLGFAVLKTVRRLRDARLAATTKEVTQ
ncbi:tripartite tricarboxylate transporter permease [Marinovum sp.]|uniref:tripartite tricarboxylate transporter permease n=1 Tax=Marinovum sp. TaxID=2024839 RepID=UPI002B272627|nr:tripartite tricarboxylate transporter permease [Marinovum sp.]